MRRALCWMRAIFCAAVMLLGPVALAGAQSLPPPGLSYVFPMGAKAGTTVELKVTGQDFGKVEGLHFSFPGTTVEVLGAGATSPSPTGPKPKKGGMKPAAGLQTHRFKVTLPADAPLGTHDVRVVTAGGISNPRAFVVGDLDEVEEQEPNDDTDKAQKIAMNGVVNGAIAAPIDVDYYTFTGKKGQRVVCSCRSTSIDSKLPAAVELYDRAGNSLGHNRGYVDGDALLDVTLPTDGEYLVRVYSYTYTLGGADCFYRLRVSTAPWIDAVFPSVVEPGKATAVTVLGRNLPGGVPDPASVIAGQVLEKITMTVTAPADATALHRLEFPGHVVPLATALDGFTLRLKNEHGTSNPYLLTYARTPVVLESGDHATRATAQSVPVPCTIAGRIEKKGDVDWYAFPAKKGAAVTIDIQGERIGAPVDLYFQIVSEKGSVITEQDDTPETMAPQFSARTDDPPRYRFVAPADGTYYLKVSSRAADNDAGPRHQYVVRIGPDAPDFQVIAMPAAPLAPDAGLVGKHGNYAFNVFVWRLGGFTGNITLTGEDLPPGLTVRPQVLANGQKQAILVVGAAADAAPFTGAIRVVGTAVIGGAEVVRAVRAATIVWPVPQANILTVTRLDRELVLAVRGTAPYSLAAGADKIAVVQGEKISIPVKVQTHAANFKEPVQLTALGLPPGLNLPPLTLAPGTATGTAVFETKGGPALAPGHYTIVLRGQTQLITKKQAPKMKSGAANYVQVTPPIALTIIPKQLAKLTVTPAKVRNGKPGELTVHVARQNEYTGAFKIEAVLPGSAKGWSVASGTIAPDQDEVKLVVTAAPDAPIGSTATITIRATALFDDVPVVHEAKGNLAVAK